MTRALAFFAQLILWGAVALIAATVFARSHDQHPESTNRPGRCDSGRPEERISSRREKRLAVHVGGRVASSAKSCELVRRPRTAVDAGEGEIGG